VIRLAARAFAAGVALSLMLAAVAVAATYRGAGVDDEQMPVKVKLTGSDLVFDYTDVLVGCSDGSTPRQGGASHTDRLNERNRFKDRLEIGGATSLVRGKVTEKKATGTLTYDLVYEGGECHSGEVEWKAKRK
jgi:hypothetical protein